MTAIDPRTAVEPPLDPPPAAPDECGRSRRDWRTLATAYVALTKPRIIELLLVTTIPTMVLAAGGLPGLRVTLATLFGGYLAAGSANALNCYIDRDIDRVMHRTGSRPLATGVLSPREALAFGLALGVLSVALFSAVVNALSAVLALAAIAFYVLVYTLVLKRRTPQNIVWGGAAGCMPVLIGWAAVTGSLSWAPLVLFAVVFLWTPPHYWPLAMRFREDYGRARVPMLPVVATDVAVARRVVAYSWAMVGASVLLWPVAGTGWAYGLVSLALGAAFLREAHGLLARALAGLSGASLKPMRVFHGSISYLSLLFLAVALAPFLP